jgi:hypothetical protein
MARRKCSAWFWSVLSLAIVSGASWAAGGIHVRVQTVLASQDKAFIDPGLSGLAQELRSVFRYSSYKLLGKTSLDLAPQKTGSVTLPGERVLKITPTGITGDRVELRLVILKKEKQVFETVVQLLNNGSIIVGGPQHQNGSLLFNISASY